MLKHSNLFLIVSLAFSGCVATGSELDTEDPDIYATEEAAIETQFCIPAHDETLSDEGVLHDSNIFGYSQNYLRGPRNCGGQRLRRFLTAGYGAGSCSLVDDSNDTYNPVFWANELCARNPNMSFLNSTITQACQEFFSGGSDLGDHDCRYIVHVGAAPSIFGNNTQCQQSHSTHVPEDCAMPNDLGFTYYASNTNSAQQNTYNEVVPLAAGDTIMLGTCGLRGGQGVAAFTGDTYLRVFGPGGTQVAFNDDACGGLGSNLTFTAATSGNYEIRGGCYASGSCAGMVVLNILAGSYNFSASNTRSAEVNTVNRGVRIELGQSITLGTCGVAGGNFTGDTYLRLFRTNHGYEQVVPNDDACGGLGSNLTYYNDPNNSAGGMFQIRAGCYSSGSCSGTVAWTIQ